MDRPSLVILPTSLIFNWKREAERFAPALRVLSLHGRNAPNASTRSPNTTSC
jgi:SNF2 family DNA or RNA helicase